jgi:AraC family transcriptional regulator of adaptative response/methylated-DNA-[protein]-cysteine methyltransferase
MVRQACEWMVACERRPGLTELARRGGLSPHHFHRVFTEVVGITPAQYARAVRDGRVRLMLGASSSVTEAFHAAGFESSGRFYENARHRLGMTPGRYRSGGRGETVQYAVSDCSLGVVLVAATSVGVCALLLGEDPGALVEALTRQFPHAALVQASATMSGALRDAIAAVDSPRPGSDVPLDIRGTVFQQRVWEALRAIPHGETCSYQAVAARIGRPGAARAVARACAQNPLAVLVPCHRVCRADGTAGGFRWGLAKKRALLAREQ